MNYRLGKLSVLAGFAGITLIACVQCVVYFLLSSDPFLNTTFIDDFTGVLNVLCRLAIAAGFCITFLEERGTLNLLIAGGFGLWAVYLALNTFSLIPLLNSIISLVFSLISIASMSLWAYKMWRSNRIAAIAIIGGVLLPFSMGLFSSFLFPMMGATWYLVTSIVYVIEDVAFAYAAYLDMN